MPGSPEVFRLTALLLIADVASTVPAAPGLKADEQKDQEAAVALIKRLGGEVFCDFQRPNPDRPDLFDLTARPADPAALHRVVAVRLKGTKVSDDDLRALARLPALENLDLSDTAVSGAGLAHHKGLMGVRVMGLRNTRVGDAGLEHLKGMTRMWDLALGGTRVTDAGLAHLAGMAGLRRLDLAHTEATPGGVQALRAKSKAAMDVVLTGRK
jgi:hypothetical protein